MITALPMMIGSVGASRQTSQPISAAHRIAEYCSGASTAARVIASAWTMQTKQSIDTAPTRAMRPRSRRVGVVHANGVVAAPIRPLPTNCHNDQRRPVDAPELAGDRLTEREHDRAEKRKRRDPGKHLRRGPERNDHADEADEDGDPAEALDLLAEQRRRERGDDQRRRHIEGHHVGERHEARRVVERERVDRGDNRSARPAAAPGAGR